MNRIVQAKFGPGIRTRLIAMLATVAILLFANLQATATDLQFEITIKPGLITNSQTGRLFVIMARNQRREPRIALGSLSPDEPHVVARDVKDFAADATSVLDQSCIAFPVTNLAGLPAGDYFVQALLDSNRDLRSPQAPGNLFSDVVKLHLDPAHGGTEKLQLSQRVPDEQLPEETEFVKFVKFESPSLSKFHGRPIYLRAGIILPRGYAKEPGRKYPLWVQIGGFNTRYSSVKAMMSGMSPFRRTWLGDGTPQLILLQLDGAGPYGDCYQVNSANNGPYGDAVTQELIPFIENKFRAAGKPEARFLSGVSTGGWVSLALQVFYPDFFNGTWTCCPDGVDFRAFELVNIYNDENAYVNRFGFERPSERTLNGDTRLTMRHEVGIENVLGAGDNWTLSGGQWGAWNAVYGPRGADGKPVPLWDPQTGKIDHAVAEQWKKYDLRLVMEQNWKTLGPKLQGKLHISVGDADNYFLNNGVHLLDEFLSKADPPYRGRVAYGPGKGHGWSDISTLEMLQEMEAAAKPAEKN